jgi:hypothetical protein
MSLSSFLIRLILLSLPGIVGSLLYRSLKGRPSKKDWEDVVEIALFSLLSYSAIGLIVDLINLVFKSDITIQFFQALFDEKAPIAWYEIYLAIGVASFLSFVGSYLYTNNVINGLGRKMGVTSMFGNNDVWSFFQERFEKEWVIVRDHKTDLVYLGHILAYSDTEKERELLLDNVTVHSNSTGSLLYGSDFIYISRARDSLTIEIQPENGGANKITDRPARSVVNELVEIQGSPSKDSGPARSQDIEAKPRKAE